MSNMFSFDPPASSGASGPSLFGTAGKPNTGTNPSGGLFGNVGAPSSGTSSPSLFGTGSATGQGQGSSLFGNAGGGVNAANGSASPFALGGQNKPATTTQAPLFGSAQTPKPAETPGSAQGTGMGALGNAAKPANALFGNAAATPGQSGGLFGSNTSTTPAGPPPQGSAAGQGQSLFGQTAAKPGNLFGGLNTATGSSSGPSTTTSTATASPFGAPSQPPATGGGLFGGGSNTQQKPLFGSTPSAPAGNPLFGNAGKDKPADSTTPAAAAQSSSNPLFGNTPAPASGTTQTSNSLFKAQPSGMDTTAKPAFSLGGATSATTPQPSTTPATSTATPQKSLFPSAATPAMPSSTPAAAPSGGMFANLGGSKPTEAGAAGAATTTAASTQPALTGGLFPKLADTATSTQPATTSANSTSTTTDAKPSIPAMLGTTPATGAAATAGTPATGAAALGASTAGPTPPAQSRLKNKTMDEIITRWASDLTKYQKDFREQAEKVAEWDRMLVENISKVQKLYGNTVDAERATQEVERQLASVEGQQEELSSWLDRYEREVDEMMSKQVGPGESLQGPDQERERTYKMAEKLSERLDEMGKDLTSMIEEVNGASATLSKTNKADEPISQIVRILNSHLSQLQVIDQGTTELQVKVSAAQKAGQGLSSRFGQGFNNSGMGGGDATGDFFNSYMGRR
ncbi:FG-nucleoporin nsp1 [Aspergillus nanangensis]|uniref:Nucleoporin NSP1 n=1 Tax=Aspergillus nanangensis TaxID=2582783 RepID=A0AAD4GQ47_ASPNN|nr:FG-nucleoporin nsp1 [Aspergillus nanangensis]